MYITVTSLMNEHMSMSRFAPCRFRVFWTKATTDWNIQRTGYPVSYCVFLSILLPLFWSSKVRDTAWYWKVSGLINSILLWCTTQNSMFLSLIKCVFLSPFVAFTYSHDFIAEKNPITARFYIDNRMSVMDLWNNWKRKKGVKDFSCFVSGSLLM